MNTICFLSLVHKRKLGVFLVLVPALIFYGVNPAYSIGNVTANAVVWHTRGNDPKPIVISLKVVQNVLQYDKKVLTVKAGQKVTINFENPDFMQHNLVIIKPGSTDKVGAAVDLLAADPNGAKMNYIPKLKEVLFSTRLLSPQEKVSLQFTAPAQPGDYPYLCTFPGHWRIMNGVMKVTK